ncbi:potassium/sodium eff [Microstroma glucosiphilum]|uniref:P-type Na(+) transporter n=1 Tax=Pseudomicrostroma glucosiphilum TaxID=1684307 RepID=A0A316U3T1_9BASI|nr:potassium/sodium eff [Pseudomicrostroma glucosiphilum]PWN19887.1 potassium/sodium eff [Pseudomicrostroma glucosiphilum]
MENTTGTNPIDGNTIRSSNNPCSLPLNEQAIVDGDDEPPDSGFTPTYLPQQEQQPSDIKHLNDSSHEASNVFPVDANHDSEDGVGKGRSRTLTLESCDLSLSDTCQARPGVTEAKEPAPAPVIDGDSAFVAEMARMRGHTMTGDEVIALLNTTTTGLTSQEATNRLETYGQNVIAEQKPTSMLTIFVRQVANCMTVVLLAALALSFGVRDWVEGGVVAAVIVTNIVIGFTQEYKAESTMASLRDLSSPTAEVYRDGELQTLQSALLVPGDVVAVKVGDLLPADVRLTSLSNLETSEASLTGESLPVVKVIDALFDPTFISPPADRINLAYSSTIVTKGRATGTVIATGPHTQLGKIAEEMGRKQATDCGFWSRTWEKMAGYLGLRGGTPLQIKMNKFAYVLLAIAVVCAIIVFAVAEFELNSEILLYAIALAIGVVPESLIPVLTITFSVGAKRMAQSGVVIRRIEALEALGGVSLVCSDKTGTLTQGKMVTRKLWLPDGESYGLEEAAAAVEPVGRIYTERAGSTDAFEYIANANLPLPVRDLAVAASLCNVAELSPPNGSDRMAWSARGDPTEIALLVMATKLGLGRPSLVGASDTQKEKRTTDKYELCVEYPFESEVKLMTSVYITPDGDAQAFMKGAVERLLVRCIGLDEAAKRVIYDQAEKLAGQGLRVLAFATRRLSADVCDSLTRPTCEQSMTFIGLCALYDPPRPTSRAAVLACRKAGITIAMLTGDHKATAAAIARDIGILQNTDGKDAILTAQEFEALSDEAVDKLPELPKVIARCSPSTKVRMIHAGRRRNMFIAMTGDGVNDAPALKQSNVGIAMGMTGTDVAKAAADMVLTDDCFESIVKAIKEGRTIFDNIQRFVVALLVANVGEVLLLLVGLAFRDDEGESVFPLTAVEILWINMVTASLPAIGLGMEQGGEEIMNRPPADVLGGGVFSKAVITDMLFYGVQMGWTCLVVFIAMIYGPGGGELGRGCNASLASSDACSGVLQARSAVFTALTLQNLLQAWCAFSLDRTIFSLQAAKHIYRNPLLFWSVLGGAATVPLCLYVPVFNEVVFHHAALNGVGWGVAMAATVLFVGLLEAWKYLARRGGNKWLTRVTGGEALAIAKPSASIA